MSMIAVSIVFTCNGCEGCLVASTNQLTFEPERLNEWFLGFDQDYCAECRHKFAFAAAIANQERQMDNLRTRLIARIRAAIPEFHRRQEVKHAA